MKYLNSVPIFILALFFIVIVKSSGDILTPNFIKPCDNPRLPGCLKSAIQEAIPGFVRGSRELGIYSLDPLTIDELSLTLPGGINITLTDGVVQGFKQCTVITAKLRKNNLELSLRCSIEIKGKYKSTGRLLIFHIDGEGDSFIKCKNLDLTVKMNIGTTVQQDGRTYLQVKSYSSRHKYSGQVFYHMTNLIKNNPEISKAVVQFMNANWKMIAEEFGDPLVNTGVRIIVHEVKKLFSKVPLQQFMKRTNNSVYL